MSNELPRSSGSNVFDEEYRRLPTQSSHHDAPNPANACIDVAMGSTYKHNIPPELQDLRAVTRNENGKVVVEFFSPKGLERRQMQQLAAERKNDPIEIVGMRVPDGVVSGAGAHDSSIAK